MPAAAHRQTQADRIVLLVDLDCFYAQCECIRLGYDSTTTPLALLQWNSVLAVTYPARKLFGIKRGDGWDEVRRKSNGRCLSVHVPMLSHANTISNPPSQPSVSRSTGDENDESNNDENPFPSDALDEEYDKIFLASDADNQAARKELGVRRFSLEGKACIERYRLASRRIFGTILEYIEELNKNLKHKLVMERASIDELFFDVSGACFTDAIVKETDDDFQSALHATKIIGEEESTQRAEDDYDPLETLAFQKGVVLASRIRKHVRDKLNFTMTAGIGHNKTIAKLSASYGKPNGQAVTLPNGVEYLLMNTEIKKCRNFGGKLGKRIQALLPENATATMGSIAQCLPLPQLEAGLGDSGLARWVHQAVRGIDAEAVVAKEQSLIKSITAFKSLPFHADGHTIEQAEPWIRLLAQEVVKRVQQDSERNSRYPKSLNIHYAAQGWGHQKTISIRIDFPAERLSSEEKINLLSESVPKLILKKAGREFKYHRIGLCAESFMSREKAGKAISSYFAPKVEASPLVIDTVDQPSNQRFSISNQENAVISHSIVTKPPLDTPNIPSKQTVDEDRDLEVAKALQAEYDREQRMLETLERRDKCREENPRQKSKKRPNDAEPSNTKRIDSFFRKR